MKLPELFLTKMEALLKDEYPAWLSTYESPSCQGIRMNTLKTESQDWSSVLKTYRKGPVPWTSNGFYSKEDVRPAKDPYYYAGLYYLQEPSAMAPAAMLPVKPGDKVLDLCAAPGGKSTELGARLKGSGLLVSNDISNSRAKALLKNLELFGIANLCVTSEAPGRLSQVFESFFDHILVDAPCSGEGMFRKEPELIKSWMDRGPEHYVPIQREILTEAVGMLKPGGHLLYSTCTFSKAEDEDNVLWLLGTFPQMRLSRLSDISGAVPAVGLESGGAIRLFPHRILGEGHFIALLEKENTETTKDTVFLSPHGDQGRKDVDFLEKHTDFFQFEQQLNRPFFRDRLMVKDNQVYELPEGFRREWNLRYLRTGLWLGTLKKGRFEPSQAFAMTLKPSQVKQTITLSHEDQRVMRYLKGETIVLDQESQAGWYLVCLDQYPLGWAKGAGITLKNKYYPGWRWQ